MGSEEVRPADCAVLGDDLRELAQVSGVAFFQKLVECMSARFQAELVTIGELKVMDTERINVLAGVFDGFPLGDFEYEACVTPCFDVLNSGGTKIVLSEVQEAYPQDEMFIEEGIQSYVGLALLNGAGEAQGLIQAAWRRKISDQEAEEALSAMLFFHQRLNDELSTMQELSVLEAIARGPSETSSKDVFRLICEQMQKALKVRVAFIAECVDDDESCFRLLSYCYEGRIIEEVEGRVMPYAGTPCENLRDCEQFVISSGLQETFPEDESFKEQNLHSYLGLAVKDTDGEILGHIAIQNDKEIPESSSEAKLMYLFSARVGLELRRYKADIRRMRSEAALTLKRKTESLGLLTRSIAQEFNSQLVQMREQVEAAGQTLEAGHAALGHLENAEAGIEASIDLVSQIQDFSQGQEEGELDSRELNKLVAEATAFLPDTHVQNKAFKLDLAVGLPRVSVEETQIRQMVLNLVFNALEAIGPDGGEVVVSTRVQTVRTADREAFLNGGSNLPDNCIVLEVKDNGEGMHQETLERIFDPFFTTKPQGRGVGLTTVLGILDRHQGAVRVDSEVGLGTSVRIYLPPCQQGLNGAATDRTMSTRTRRGDRRVLVIDDEKSVQKAIGGLLQLRGCRVDLADGPAEARALVQDKGPYLCVVIGAQSAERGGWDTLMALREQQSDLPCVMISGQHTGAAVSETETAEVTVLDKPFSKEKLYRAVFA